ncbi:MAG: hypothetical protein KKA55_11035 [Proteobacteria bacterium]|nr:hypothetical protein [Pseudomonadota bacterium]MBU1596053.1 hypothetical protein [Pseudomonadota bacterium]
MRTLYLVYRVTAEGERHPETIMAMVEADLGTAAEALDRVIHDDNPEDALREGERWEFVPQELASIADWEEIAPPNGRSMPY